MSYSSKVGVNRALRVVSHPDTTEPLYLTHGRVAGRTLGMCSCERTGTQRTCSCVYDRAVSFRCDKQPGSSLEGCGT